MNEKTRFGLLLALIASAPLQATTPGDAADLHSLESIRDAAIEHVRSTSTTDATRLVAVADAIDARLRLPRCTAPLDTDLPYASARSQRVTVEVRCSGDSSWKILVPVRLETFGPVVVAARTIPRDGILTASDLAVEELELGALSRGHIREIEHALGKRVRRAISAGSPITPNVIVTPPLIRRGQKVSVKAGGTRLSITSAGTALSDGGLGEIIDVTNDSSGRRVQGIVRSARVVEVLLD